MNLRAFERHISRGPGGRFPVRTRVASPEHARAVDARWDHPVSTRFDTLTTETVPVPTGKLRDRLGTGNAAHRCLATFPSPGDCMRFPDGSWDHTPDRSHAAAHRRALTLARSQPGRTIPEDPRNLVAVLAGEALREGQRGWMECAIDDHLEGRCWAAPSDLDFNQGSTSVGVPAAEQALVPRTCPRSDDSRYFTAPRTSATGLPLPKLHDIVRAREGRRVELRRYVWPRDRSRPRPLRSRGTDQRARSLSVSDGFRVNLLEAMSCSGPGSVAWVKGGLPGPPDGTQQRPGLFTGHNGPGQQGARLWLESSPDSSRSVLGRSDAGDLPIRRVALWGSPLRPVRRRRWSGPGATRGRPIGSRVVRPPHGSACMRRVTAGPNHRPTERNDAPAKLRSVAHKFLPDGRPTGLARPGRVWGRWWNRKRVGPREVT